MMTVLDYACALLFRNSIVHNLLNEIFAAVLY